LIANFGGSTMSRFVLGGFAVGLLALAGAAAPVPKDEKGGAPDLKEFFSGVGKAVKDEKWPAEADEKALKGTAQKVLDRMLKAAEQKERKLPVDFTKLEKIRPAQKFKQTVLKDGFVVAGDVQINGAENSVIFASGDVQITRATNCVVVAQNVRCTVVENCVVIAGDYIRLNGADRRDGQDPCVLVAGQWIRTTTMNETVCHVLRPSGLPAPDEAKFAGNQLHPAVRTNQADGVIFLNDRDDTRANGPKNCTYLPQKNPIAK
jgi:hypothetical protein